MAFEQANVNYAAEYSAELRNAYPYLSYFSELYGSPESQRFRPGMGSTVYIPSLTAKGARARTRGEFGGSKKERNVNNEWQAFTLEMEREWDTTLDPNDITQTGGALAVANATKTFVEQQKIPEMDAYAASKLYALASSGSTLDETAITSTNVLTVWDGYLKRLKNARVRKENLLAYATPTFMESLKGASGITRFVETGSGTGTMINRDVDGLDKVQIKEVPEDIMQSAFDFSEGWAKGGDAKQINLILVDKTAVFAPVLYQVSMTQAPSALTANNWYYYEAYSYGLGIHKTRTAGLLVNAAAASE